MGKKKRKGVKCICDDQCKWKCRSRKEHDLREQGKTPIVFGKKKPEKPLNPVLTDKQGGFLKSFCE
jgi:hypothetical protein